MNFKQNKILKKIVENYKVKKNKSIYPLLDDAFSSQDILEGIKVLLSRQITMSKIVTEFEKKFAKFIGSKFALMVNSGSSANLLAVFASCNPLIKNRFYPNDEAIIPSLCWSTSLWPIVQAGLKPVFIDVDKTTMNVNADELIKKITKKTRLIMAIHVLGNSTDILKIRDVCKKKKIILIEDTCESLGGKFKNKYLGTFGDFGTYSFYYSHQITSGEGGMIVCSSEGDYKLLHSLRAHGWSRGPNEKDNNHLYKNKDKRFIFINSGFNLRPMEISAAIGLNQFKRLNKFISIRKENRNKIIQKIKLSKKWNNQFEFLEPSKSVKPSWFGLPILVDKKYMKIKNRFLNYLAKKGIETRPIISGNFLNQPAAKLYKLNSKKLIFKGAQEIEDRGFFIGLHTKKISNQQLNLIEKSFFYVDNFI
jgi:CDP-6-deoxy-D-xylo-4-hexulose-3-dehydrase